MAILETLAGFLGNKAAESLIQNPQALANVRNTISDIGNFLSKAQSSTVDTKEISSPVSLQSNPNPEYQIALKYYNKYLSALNNTQVASVSPSTLAAANRNIASLQNQQDNLVREQARNALDAQNIGADIKNALSSKYNDYSALFKQRADAETALAIERDRLLNDPTFLNKYRNPDGTISSSALSDATAKLQPLQTAVQLTSDAINAKLGTTSDIINQGINAYKSGLDAQSTALKLNDLQQQRTIENINREQAFANLQNATNQSNLDLISKQMNVAKQASDLQNASQSDLNDYIGKVSTGQSTIGEFLFGKPIKSPSDIPGANNLNTLISTLGNISKQAQVLSDKNPFKIGTEEGQSYFKAVQQDADNARRYYASASKPFINQFKSELEQISAVYNPSKPDSSIIGAEQKSISKIVSKSGNNIPDDTIIEILDYEGKPDAASLGSFINSSIDNNNTLVSKPITVKELRDRINSESGNNFDTKSALLFKFNENQRLVDDLRRAYNDNLEIYNSISRYTQ